jgi:hypothetical protein
MLDSQLCVVDCLTHDPTDIRGEFAQIVTRGTDPFDGLTDGHPKCTIAIQLYLQQAPRWGAEREDASLAQLDGRCDVSAERRASTVSTGRSATFEGLGCPLLDLPQTFIILSREQYERRPPVPGDGDRLASCDVAELADSFLKFGSADDGHDVMALRNIRNIRNIRNRDNSGTANPIMPQANAVYVLSCPTSSGLTQPPQ